MNLPFPNSQKNITIQKVLARQPILDRHQKTFAYELLFRTEKTEKAFPSQISGEAATLNVINSLLSFGLENIVGNKKAFINFTTELLVEEYFNFLPQEIVVIEILENVDLNSRTIEACKKAKKQGFQLALDDFFFREGIKPLIQLSDIIKIDFQETSKDQIRRLTRYFKAMKKSTLAEKVETTAEFNEALSLNFDYFQGFFFSRPQIVSQRDIPAYKASLLRIIRETQQETNLEKMSSLIAQDLALSWKLLKFINSAFFSLRAPVSSISRAAAMLGERELKRWIMLIAISEIATDRPSELVVQATLRAKFAELIGQKLGGESLGLKAFTAGIFSLMDVILQRPMKEILEKVPLEDPIKRAIVDKSGKIGKIIQLIISCENMDIEKIDILKSDLGISSNDLEQIYLQALKWTNKFFSFYMTALK